MTDWFDSDTWAIGPAYTDPYDCDLLDEKADAEQDQRDDAIDS